MLFIHITPDGKMNKKCKITSARRKFAKYEKRILPMVINSVVPMYIISAAIRPVGY